MQFGITPLMAAARTGHSMVVKLLIDKGADVTPVNEDGQTALQLAKDKASITLIKNRIAEIAEIERLAMIYETGNKLIRLILLSDISAAVALIHEKCTRYPEALTFVATDVCICYF